MKHIIISSIPKRKRRAICVYDDETNNTHVIAYIFGDEELLIDTLLHAREIRVAAKEEDK